MEKKSDSQTTEQIIKEVSELKKFVTELSKGISECYQMLKMFFEEEDDELDEDYIEPKQTSKRKK